MRKVLFKTAKVGLICTALAAVLAGGISVMAADKSNLTGSGLIEDEIECEEIFSKTDSTSSVVYVTDDGKLVDPNYVVWSPDYSAPYSDAYAYYLELDTENNTAALKGINNDYFVEKAGTDEYDLELPGEIIISGTVNDDLFENLKEYEGTYKITKIAGISNSTLKSISFPEGDDKIEITGSSAFFNSDNLTEVTIPANIVFTSDRAFQACYNLRNVTLCEGVTAINNRMFADCKKLENINIPNTVTSIGDQAFMNCESLVKINGSTECIIPDSVTSMQEGAFGNCGFTTVTLPKDLKYPESDSWGYFSGLYLASLNLEEIKVASGGNTPLYAEDGVLYYNDGAKKRLIAYPSGKTDENVIFEDDMILTRGSIADNPYIKNITFKKSVIIESWALHGSNMAELNDSNLKYGLESVTFNGDTEISSYGFEGCELLTEFKFADDATVILENGCIKECDALKNFTFPKKYEIRKNESYDVGFGPFYRCPNLETVSVYEDSDIATSSGAGLDARYFFQCNNFTRFQVIPVEGFEKLDGKGCSVDDNGVLFDSTKSVLAAWPTGLTVDSYEIPADTSSIKSYAFYTVKGPKVLDTGDETEGASSLAIGSHAFDSTGLNTITMDPATDTCMETVKITSRVKEIGEHCFDKCLALAEVTIADEGITELPRGAFRNCTALKELILPDSITRIAGTSDITGTMDGALNNCSAMEKLVLPSKLGTLEQRSIYGCSSLKEVIIPESVGAIETGCFMICRDLSKVTFMNKGIMTIEDDAFYGVGAPTSGKSCVFVVAHESSAEEFVKARIAKAEEDYINYSQSYKDIEWSVRYLGENFVKFIDYMNEGASDNDYIVWEGTAKEDETLADILPEGALPDNSGNSKNIFKGWFTNSYDTDDQVEADLSLTVTEDMTFYAQYEYIPQEFIITLMSDGVVYKTLKVSEMQNINEILSAETPSKTGYEFLGWSDSTDGAVLDNIHHLYEDTTLYAVWKALPVVDPGDDPSSGGNSGGTSTGGGSSTGGNPSTGGSSSTGGGTSTGANTSSGGSTDATATPTTVTTGTKETDATTGATYTVIETTATGEVEVEYKPAADVKDTKVTIPETVTVAGGKATVTSISDDAFADNKTITSVTIPKTVEEIGDNAFKGCTGLTTVSIPAAVESIGESAFQGCTKLKKVTIPKGTKTVGKNAFSGCSGLTSVTIQSTTITEIAQGAFKNCKKLTKITITKGVTKIGKDAFSGDKKLKTITIKSTKIKSVGKNAFKNVPKSATVKVPMKQKKAYTKLLKKAGFKGKIR